MIKVEECNLKKILYIDISLDGHRGGYLKELLNINLSQNYEICVLLPGKLALDGINQFQIKSGYDKKRTLVTYIKFINEIKKIVIQNKIDIVHFLCGDALYRFFGLKLSSLKCRVIVTYHHVVLKPLKKISIKRIFKKSSAGVVHTEEIYNMLNKNSIENVCLVDYPMLDKISTKKVLEAKKYYNLPLNIPILGCIGGTSSYKGLDFLIEALNKVDKECCLFVAGKVYNFDKGFIENHLNNPKIKLNTVLKMLSEEEFADAIQASDVIMLPYREQFDGASGILIESVFHNKHVIGSNHGSMGDLITKYGLGLTFETNNMQDLIDKIEKDLNNPYQLSEKSNEYKEKLSTKKFIESNIRIYNNLLND